MHTRRLAASSIPQCFSALVYILRLLDRHLSLAIVDIRYPDPAQTLVSLFRDPSARARCVVDIFTVDVLCFVYGSRLVPATSIALLESVQFKLFEGPISTRDDGLSWKDRTILELIEKAHCSRVSRAPSQGIKARGVRGDRFRVNVGDGSSSEVNVALFRRYSKGLKLQSGETKIGIKPTEGNAQKQRAQEYNGDGEGKSLHQRD